jgi:hypothetical protein
MFFFFILDFANWIGVIHGQGESPNRKYSIYRVKYNKAMGHYQRCCGLLMMKTSRRSKASTITNAIDRIYYQEYNFVRVSTKILKN